MRYRLRTLLVFATIGPPVVAGAWFFLVRLAELAARTDLDDWMPLLKQGAALAGVIALMSIAALVCQRTTTTN